MNFGQWLHLVSGQWTVYLVVVWGHNLVWLSGIIVILYICVYKLTKIQMGANHENLNSSASHDNPELDQCVTPK